MRKPLLFISHSSDDNVLVRAIAEGLQVQAPGQGVLLDVNHLESGRPWQRDLHEWLARCTSGLVLLTQAVLDRPAWVLKEAIILGWRKDLENADFGLFYALGPGLTRQQFIDKGFSAAQFGTLQNLAAPAHLDAVGALVDEVIQRLPKQRCRTPHDDLVNLLKSYLLAGNSANEACEALCTLFSLSKPAHWGPDRIDQLADLVASVAIDRHEAGGVRIDQLLQELHLLDRPRKRQVAELLAPLWIDPRAAAMLRLALPARPELPPPSYAGVGIRGDKVATYTARMYLRRAYGAKTEVLHTVVVCGNGPDIAGTVSAGICGYMRTVSDDLTPLDDDKLVIEELRHWPEPIYVTLDRAPEDASLRLLRSTFPRCLFITPLVEHDPPRPAGEDLLVLEPEIDRTIEFEQLQQWRQAQPYFK